LNRAQAQIMVTGGLTYKMAVTPAADAFCKAR
jgi:hypothetical protein